MSAWGRLWRRAPAWRFCLFTAVTATALAAMFPPTPPAWRPRWWPTADTATPHYTPQPQTPAPAYDAATFPPPGAERHGIIPLAGRQLPLPAGSWQELALIRGGGELQLDLLVLARIEDSQLTGLIQASTPNLPGTLSGRAELPPRCLAPGSLAHRITPANLNDPAEHECWTLVPADLTQGPWQPGQHSVERAVLERLAQLRVITPTHMLSFSYIRTDDSRVQTVTLLLPDNRQSSRGQVQRLQDWMNRFETRLSKGFSGNLTNADMTAAVVSDPK